MSCEVIMKSKNNIILSFAPWIVFSAGLTTFLYSAIIALILNIVISKKDLLRGVVLEVGGALFFALMVIVGLWFPHGNAFTQHPNLWSNIAMAGIMLGSVAINKPFTQQYTDEGTAKLHRQLSAIWGFLLLIAAVVSLGHAYFGLSNTMSTLGTIVAIFVGIKANTYYPQLYIEHIKKKLMEENKSNPYLQGNFAPVKDELEVENLQVIGKIPDDLLGVYMRNGPNPEFPPITYVYPFDGDGMIHAVYIADGKARYKNRYVQTAALLAERRAGKALYGGFKFPVLPDSKYVGENVDPFKNGAFIHIIRHANQYLAMPEADTVYEVSSELETLGLWCPETKNNPIKAVPHTRFCPKTGDLWLINYDIKPPFLTVSRIDKNGKLQFKKDIEKQYATMVHDFVLTENYVILFDCPVVFDLKKVMSGEEVLNWRPELGVRIGIMSRETGALKWIQTEAFFVFHFANAYENADEIIVDFVRHADLKLTRSKENRMPPHLYRTRINLSTQMIQHEQLDDRIIEFPRIKEDRDSLPHRFIYSTTKLSDLNAMKDQFTALIKYDVEKKTSQIHDFGNTFEIGEAVFVPKANSTSEDDGYLILFVYNKIENSGECVLLDAKNMRDEPLARIKMPRRVPSGLHGSWMSGPWQ